MRFAMFSDFSPCGAPPNLWYGKNAAGFDSLNLSHWIKLAQALEAAKFDTFFWADHSGLHDTYRNSAVPTLEMAVQFPIADPWTLAAALASSTTHLGFGISANMIQYHPYVFARKVATLDHLTGGRVGWNVVTSFQKSAWQNQGYNDVEPHVTRYRRAEEYLEVVYKLLEGSWEDDAVLRDVEDRKYVDASKVHRIHHSGEFYSVPGINMVPASPQRTPVLFQAGTSEEGRAFSSKHAEGVFIVGSSVNNEIAMKKVIADLHQRMALHGRKPGDLHVLSGRSYMLGSTEEEAQRLDREVQQAYRDTEYGVAYMSSTMGIDLSTVDIDKPVGEFKSEAIAGGFKSFIDAVPNKLATFRDIANYLVCNRFVGTPEQAADEIAAWRDLGVTGINYQQMTGPGEVYTFIEHVCPILKKRGLMQTEYSPGTFREKLFGEGPRLPDRHPGAKVRNMVHATPSIADTDPPLRPAEVELQVS